jgi:hypothetical protein
VAASIALFLVARRPFRAKWGQAQEEVALALRDGASQ